MDFILAPADPERQRALPEMPTACRHWIEQGFRGLKRGGWPWPLGVSKDLGLGNGVYRSSTTRINLSVSGLTAPQIAALVNSKTMFQNDSRTNPIRITAHRAATPGWKTVDGRCEMSEAFLGFDVSARREAFSGGRD